MDRTTIARLKADTHKARETHAFASFFALLLSMVSAYITALFFVQITKPLLATGFLVGSVFTLIKIFSARKVAELHYHRDRIIERLRFESDVSHNAARKRWRLGLMAYAAFMLAGVAVSLVNSSAFLNNMMTNAKVDDRVLDATIGEKVRALDGHRDMLKAVGSGDKGSKSLAMAMAAATTEHDIRAIQARIGAAVDGDAKSETKRKFAEHLDRLQQDEAAQVTVWTQKISSLESELANLRISKAGLDQVGWQAGVIGVGAIMLIVALIMEIAEVALHFTAMSYQREHKLTKDIKRVTDADHEVYTATPAQLTTTADSLEDVFNLRPTPDNV